MRLRLPLAVAIVFAAVLGCTPQEIPSAGDNARDVDAINAVLAAHVVAANSGDTAANLAGFTDDLVYMPPDQPPVRGKQALASLIGPLADGFEVQIEMVPEETIVSGDWAFQWGSVAGSIRPLAGGDSTVMDAKYVYLYQRQSDGSWKIARDMYNSNVPPVQNE